MKHSIVVLWLTAGFCMGQTLVPDTWDTLSSIPAGHKIRVVTTTKNHSGTFTASSSDAITINGEEGQRSIARADVVRVYVQGHSKRLRNTLIGAGIGAAIGIATYSTFGTYYRNEGVDNTGVLLAAPIGIGTGIGAVLPAGSMKKVYDRKDDVSRP